MRDVSGVLDHHFRDSDLLGRFGGDEFVAFMPAPLESAREIAERRAQEIINDISQVTTSDGSHTACSVGVAICGNREATFYDMLEVADQAMYESKDKGKGVYTIKEMTA